MTAHASIQSIVLVYDIVTLSMCIVYTCGINEGASPHLQNESIATKWHILERQNVILGKNRMSVFLNRIGANCYWVGNSAELGVELIMAFLPLQSSCPHSF